MKGDTENSVIEIHIVIIKDENREVPEIVRQDNKLDGIGNGKEVLLKDHVIEGGFIHRDHNIYYVDHDIRNIIKRSSKAGNLIK